ncbi:MAG TPA: PEP-utilizing enzyme [Acidimicrobiia bacterium]|nr:PEP-utilizing enzyme [Acidimicrobiia bacterium]
MIDDPIHTRSGPTTFWTTVNAAEALPGVVTPLTWTLYAPVVEHSVRTAFAELGVLRRSEVIWPDDPDQRFIGVFCGRAAVNLDRFRAMADRSPGQSGDAVEREFFGTVRPGVTSTPEPGRYPFVAAKTPVAALRAGRRLGRLEAEADAWWHRVVSGADLGDPTRARAVLGEARDLFTRVMVPHTIGTMLAPAFFGRLAALVTAAGRPGLELRLLTGQPMHETAWLAELWAVSRGRAPLAGFVDRYGYHGPDEGELAARPWREDPAPLQAMVERFRSLPDDEAPAAVERRRAREAVRAEQELMASLSPLRRPGARTLLRITRHFMPLRETGRSAFLRAVDGARAAARSLGAHLHDAGVLKAPDDVFFLTFDELTDPAPGPLADIVAARRARYEEYRAVRLPDCWVGDPPRVAATDAAGDETGGLPLHGFAVSPGIVEGRARVIARADDLDSLEPGEILVCPFTDPSWSLGFLVAAGLVIDVGGPLSHGAIVARELGVPCVINTRVGTSVLHTGDVVRVDGAAGTVALAGPT